jgi:hypothetical protein
MIRYELIASLIISTAAVADLTDLWQLNQPEIDFLKSGRKIRKSF